MATTPLQLYKKKAENTYTSGAQYDWDLLPATNTPFGWETATADEFNQFAKADQQAKLNQRAGTFGFNDIASAIGQSSGRVSEYTTPWGETLKNVDQATIDEITANYGKSGYLTTAQFKAQNEKLANQPQQPTGQQVLSNVTGSNNWNNYYQQVLNNPSASTEAKAEAQRMLGNSNSVSGNNGGEQTYATGNQQLDAMLLELNKVLTNITNQGQIVNPNIELTPAQIQQFTDLASQQISPYYRQQIEAMKVDMSKSIENLQKQYDITKQDTEAQFKSSLGTSRENMAGTGLTFSGNRGQAENQMVEAQNRSLDLSALQTENQIGSNLRTLEQTIGSANFPTLPQYQTYRASSQGEGSFTPGRTLSFTGIGGIEGSLQKQQREAELLRQSKYKQATREGRSLDFYL